MTTQESIKPLVDRILSNPLQFNAAMISNKSNNNDTSAAPENSSYIVIGKQHNNNSNSTAIAATFGPLLEVPILLILAMVARILKPYYIWNNRN